MPQAERWDEMQPNIKALVKASEGVPAPPVPDDQWSQKMNDLRRTVEGLYEQLKTRVEMEQEADELHQD